MPLSRPARHGIMPLDGWFESRATWQHASRCHFHVPRSIATCLSMAGSSPTRRGIMPLDGWFESRATWHHASRWLVRVPRDRRIRRLIGKSRHLNRTVACNARRHGGSRRMRTELHDGDALGHPATLVYTGGSPSNWRISRRRSSAAGSSG